MGKIHCAEIDIPFQGEQDNAGAKLIWDSTASTKFPNWALNCGWTKTSIFMNDEFIRGTCFSFRQ
jgi:hypothetical protein